MVPFRLVEISVRELRCGVSFWLCSHLMLCTWWVDNLVVDRHVARLL